MRTQIRTLVIAAVALALVSCGDDPVEPGIDPPVDIIEKPEDLVAELEVAYRRRDPSEFASLLANNPENNAEFLFLLVEPTDQGEEQWGFTEEVRIHRRMFRPEDLDPGEPEIHLDLWLQQISISLTQATPFEERTDRYISPENPDGLDPEKWRASDSRYGTFVFFDTVSDTDFLVEGEANFVVIEDLTKAIGDDGKFLLYRWEDLGGSHPVAPLVSDGSAYEEQIWGAVKGLYR